MRSDKPGPRVNAIPSMSFIVHFASARARCIANGYRSMSMEINDQGILENIDCTIPHCFGETVWLRMGVYHQTVDALGDYWIRKYRIINLLVILSYDNVRPDFSRVCDNSCTTIVR